MSGQKWADRSSSDAARLRACVTTLLLCLLGAIALVVGWWIRRETPDARPDFAVVGLIWATVSVLAVGARAAGVSRGGGADMDGPVATGKVVGSGAWAWAWGDRAFPVRPAELPAWAWIAWVLMFVDIGLIRYDVHPWLTYLPVMLTGGQSYGLVRLTAASPEKHP